MTEHAIYLLGWAALSPAAVAAVTIIWRMVAPQWQRIWSLACGHPELPQPTARAALAKALGQ